MRPRPLATAQPGWIRRLDELHLLTPLASSSSCSSRYLVTAFLGHVINRVLKGRTFGLSPSGLIETTVPTHRRGSALASSLRSAIVGVVWTVAIITIVGEFDINLGAFVATATVIGGAIGFQRRRR